MAHSHTRKASRRHPSDGKQRFYLLPGQGGSGYRRKQRIILQSSILVGVLVSLILAGILYLICRTPR